MALAIVRGPDDARDAVQDAAIIAWQRLSALRNADAWPAWFRRIAVRAALDRRRRNERLREVRLLDLEGGVEPMAHIDDWLTVRDALERMSADDRAILALRYGDDQSVPAIAETLGLPLGTAKARLHRARRRLREVLDRE